MKLIPLLFLSICVSCVHSYSEELFERIKRASLLANDAYCVNSIMIPDFLNSPISYIEQQGVKVLKVFQPKRVSLILSGNGFIGLDEERKEIIVSFRGSISVMDWLSDFYFDTAEYNPLHGQVQCEGNCLVHLGVLKQFSIIYQDVMDTYLPLLEQYPDFTTVVTGHSLGGGFAYLMGIELQTLGIKTSLVTFGALRMGNEDLNKWVDKLFNTDEALEQIKNNENPTRAYLRVIQEMDIVPLVPPGPIYGHSGIQFSIRKLSGFSPSMSQVRLDGAHLELQEIIEEMFLTGRITAILGVIDHISYFRRMALPCMIDSVM
ncbi:HBL223Wp [Eremothecium sinecaudum]|uniref:triacylglycerol lipase n=1 Tax=Eremothecium sinecaudum TaxID=45286 RepID=A0A120K0T7_9SACH|nr:HBL223Wp [Eremothecium sinecaudum]AMD18679.1 HBL223Wp [Eremothecium sinecaudum]